MLVLMWVPAPTGGPLSLADKERGERNRFPEAAARRVPSGFKVNYRAVLMRNPA